MDSIHINLLAERSLAHYTTIVIFKELLDKFDHSLYLAGHSLEGVCVGRSALELLGINIPHHNNKTCELNLLYPTIPQYAQDIIKQQNISDTSNTLLLTQDKRFDIDHLPLNWPKRMRVSGYQGKALLLHCLARRDIISISLLAYLNHSISFEELLSIGILPGDIKRNRDFLIESEHRQEEKERGLTDINKRLSELKIKLQSDRTRTYLTRPIKPFYERFAKQQQSLLKWAFMEKK